MESRGRQIVEGDGARTAGPPPGGGDSWDPWARLRAMVAVVPGRWDVPVLHAVEAGSTRPSEILHEINAPLDGDLLAEGVLFATLGKLTGRGLLERHEEDSKAIPPRTDYFLTPAGRSILSDISALGSPRTGDWWSMERDSGEAAPPGVDPAVPSPARIWNFWLGGKDNFAADRELAERVASQMPYLPTTARSLRAWQASVVRRLVGLGVRQFLDIGTGLPTAGAVHEVAQAIEPGIRVVYVDNDPMVLAHARALLASAPEGKCAYLDADLRDPAAILHGAAHTLNLNQPVAVILSAVLHFISDDDNPWHIVTRLLDGITADTYLAISHGASDLAAAAIAAGTREYNRQSPVAFTARTQAQVVRFFTGTELLVPGVVPLAQWPGLETGEDDAATGGHTHVGLGRAITETGAPG
jgi:DNA-binding HxlR family transcriptional regulator